MESQGLIKGLVASFGAVITNIFGGFDGLVTILTILIIIDYITGLLAAGVEGKLSSEIGFKGIAKKIMIFALVAVANIIDQLVASNNLIRDATIYFYVVNETLSIIENAGRSGIPIPGFLKKAVSLLRNKAK